MAQRLNYLGVRDELLEELGEIALAQKLALELDDSLTVLVGAGGGNTADLVRGLDDLGVDGGEIGAGGLGGLAGRKGKAVDAEDGLNVGGELCTHTTHTNTPK